MKFLFGLAVLFSLTFSILSYSNDGFKLKGRASLTYYFWDVYDINYLENSDKDIKVIKLKYLRDIDKDISQKGWSESLAHLKDSEKELKWFKKNCVDLKEGDELALYRIGSDKVRIEKNGKIITEETSSTKLNELIHYPWIGEKPIDKKIKKKLLGK